jgi:hypothetical protein
MTYNPNGEDTHYDPYEQAMTDPPSYFFGFLQARVWPIIGSKPAGMPWKGNTTFEDYVEELHGSWAEINRDEDRFLSTNVEFSLTPTDPTRKVMTRKVSATDRRKREFRQVVRPSIKALESQVAQVKGFVSGQFNLLEEFTDLWVKGEFVPNPDNKPDEDWKTWKFLQVFKDQAECTAAANEQFNSGDEADEAPDEQSAEDATKASLAPFLKALWNDAGHDGDVMAEKLAGNELLGKVFTMESPEVQALIVASTEAEEEIPY